MPEKHLNGFWVFELDRAVEISSLTIIDSREGKAQRMSVTNSYFHDGLNCGINLRGAQEVLIANSHAERTRTEGIVAMEDFWWGEGGFPGMLPSVLNTAALWDSGHMSWTSCCNEGLQAGWSNSMCMLLPPVEHMQFLRYMDMLQQSWHEPLHT